MLAVEQYIVCFSCSSANQHFQKFNSDDLLNYLASSQQCQVLNSDVTLG